MPESMPCADSASAILLDIEGTTTPVSFVFDVLFPFARDHAEQFLATRGHDADVQSDLALLRQEYALEVEPAPEWGGDDPVRAVPYVHFLIGCDRKSTALKSLQGKIWHTGYQSGQLKSQLFADVLPAFERWQAAGKDLYIFSSGSIQAQKLIFQYSQFGDLTPYLSGYFDTTTGPKKEVNSYQKIADAIGHPPEKILFISDVVAELEPAKNAGFQTLFSQRPGNLVDHPESFTQITDFNPV
ncbi:MAG: 2,3-diketo-5-methylthio-1-phosphopentane phosphatase MtnC [Phormidesmis priestleyi Ana]|uniref:Enolase-phosphatase E1 n=1 Tax=Phormidesmis priestleyi Ana TaxID=1666911 RepID=A0A0P7ZSF4_9CYAN|nr:MAG: 2,3-diketo-5-methylthio-1-phosphopentane phosphatase MtnC [Phormidesmis priestleyi Ana]